MTYYHRGSTWHQIGIVRESEFTPIVIFEDRFQDFLYSPTRFCDAAKAHSTELKTILLEIIHGEGL